MRSSIPMMLLAALLASGSTAAADEPAQPLLDEQTVLDSLMTFDRPMYDDLKRLRDRVGPADPQYQSRLQKARGRVQLALDNPEWAGAEGQLTGVEAQVDEQVKRYHAAANEEERATLLAELRALAERAHDLRVDSFRFRIAVLEMRLQEMEGTVEARERDRDRFIQEYLDRKLGK